MNWLATDLIFTFDYVRPAPITITVTIEHVRLILCQNGVPIEFLPSPSFSCFPRLGAPSLETVTKGFPLRTAVEVGVSTSIMLYFFHYHFEWFAAALLAFYLLLWWKKLSQSSFWGKQWGHDAHL